MLFRAAAAPSSRLSSFLPYLFRKGTFSLSLFSLSQFDTSKKRRIFSQKKRRLSTTRPFGLALSLLVSFVSLFPPPLHGDFRSENRISKLDRSRSITRRSDERFIEDRIGRGRVRPSKQTRNGKKKKIRVGSVASRRGPK